MKPGSEEWFRAESIQTMNAVYTAGDEETITHNQVIESALRRVFHDGAAQAEAVRSKVSTLPRLSEKELAALEERVRTAQAKVGYTGDYDSWITKVTPPDLE